MAKVRSLSQANLETAIMEVGPAWVGGAISDVELRAIVKIAWKLFDNLHSTANGGYTLTSKELAAAALQQYFNT